MLGPKLTRGVVLDLQRYYSQDGLAPPPSATWADKSRYKADGAITGATWVRQSNGLYALDFDPNIPSYVEIPAAFTQLNFTSEDFSIIVRIKVDDLTSWRYIFQRGAVSHDGYQFLLTAAGIIRLYTYQASAHQESSSAVGQITTGTNYTVGLSRSGTSVKLYKDGADVTSEAGTHTNPLTSARSTKIGIDDDKVNRPFDGEIEFLRVYNYALSASKQLEIHNNLIRMEGT